jgi:hypothetical protein
MVHRKKEKPEPISEAEVFYYDGAKRAINRSWLEENAVKSTSRDYKAVLYVSFEPPRPLRAEF